MNVIICYVVFLYIALSDANNAYCTKQASEKATHQTLFPLGWKVDKLIRLTEQGGKLLVQCQTIRE